MLIDFDIKDGCCLTDCPNGQKYKNEDKLKKVGSILCTRECEHFIREDRKGFKIICDFKREEQC